LLAKERTVKETKQISLVDIPFEDWAKYDKSTIYITEHRLIHNKFYELLRSGNVYSNKIKLNETEGIVRFEYENKNTIVYNPDYHAVNKTIDNLNKLFEKPKYTFKNQTLNTLAMEAFETEFGGCQTSTMNKIGDEVFHSDFIRNTQ
jgi:hypothetical protein